jgi:hypothetical protein
MTYNYSATMITCWKEFSERFFLKDEEYAAVFDDFQNFFKHLGGVFDGNVFFKKSSKSFMEPYRNDLKETGEIKITTADNSHAYLEYKKTNDVRMDKIYKSIRMTIVFQELSTEIDTRKSYQSLRPNLIHSIDATFVRIVLTRLPNPIITIHDSFGIDVLNTDLLIVVANYALNFLHDALNSNEPSTPLIESPFCLL